MCNMISDIIYPVRNNKSPLLAPLETMFLTGRGSQYRAEFLTGFMSDFDTFKKRGYDCWWSVLPPAYFMESNLAY